MSGPRKPMKRLSDTRAKSPLQRPMAELVAALVEGGVEAVSRVAQGCPVCIMASIMVHRRDEPLVYVADYESNYIDFDYQTAVREFRAARPVDY